jgi:acetoin utilization protein AcuB
VHGARRTGYGLVHAGVKGMLIPPVSRYMTSTPRIVTSHDTLSTARELMMAHSIHHLPVVDDGQLVGIVSDNDLERTRSYDEHVSDAMTCNVTRVDEAAPLDEAVTLMNAGRLGSLVVTGKAGITGIFTVTDAMRAFAEILQRNNEGER